MRLTVRKKLLAVLAVIPVVAIAACGSSGGGGTGGASAPASGSGSGLTKSPIVIGNVGVYSGSSFGGQYLQSLHSLEAWVQWTNDHGGLNGHPVKLVSHDDANNPAKALQYVKEMVEQDHIVALVGPQDPGADSAWAKYLTQQKVPAIGGYSLDDNWVGNPYMMPANVVIEGYDKGQMQAAKTLGSSVGVFLCSEFSSCKTGAPLFQGFAKDEGLEWKGYQLVAATAPDYTAQCIAMKQTGAQVVLPELDGQTTQRVIKSCATQGYTPKIVVPSALIDKDMLANPQFEGALGVSISPLWFGNADFTRDWDTQYGKMFPNEVRNGFSTLGWQAGVVFGTAMKNAPETVTAQTVAEAMWALPANSTFGGWTPPLTFDKDKGAQTSSCVWYTQIKGGQNTAPQGYQAICAK